jgi:hypothetical protein
MTAESVIKHKIPRMKRNRGGHKNETPLILILDETLTDFFTLFFLKYW